MLDLAFITMVLDLTDAVTDQFYILLWPIVKSNVDTIGETICLDLLALSRGHVIVSSLH